MIAEFERHSGLLRILLILRNEGKLNLQAFIEKYGLYSTSFYRAIEKAQQMGLVMVKANKTNHRTKKFVELTELGERISAELMKIEKELRTSSTRPGNSV